MSQCVSFSSDLDNKLSNLGTLRQLKFVFNRSIEKSLLKKDDVIKKIKQRFVKKGLIKYSFSHFDLYSDIYFTRIKKNNFAKSKWLRVSIYAKSQLPTVMKKIVKQALVNTE